MHVHILSKKAPHFERFHRRGGVFDKTGGVFREQKGPKPLIRILLPKAYFMK